MSAPAYDGPRIREARAADLKHLAGIEDAGLPMFEEVYGDLAGDPLASPAPSGGDRLDSGGVLLVAGDPPVGFVHVSEIELHAHLEQLSVRPERMREGIGSALVQAAKTEAWHLGHPEISLCTYRDLPWNGPFYARLGFVEVTRLEPYQRELRQHEQRLGLDRHGVRVVMVAPTRTRA